MSAAFEPAVEFLPMQTSDLDEVLAIEYQGLISLGREVISSIRSVVVTVAGCAGSGANWLVISY